MSELAFLLAVGNGVYWLFNRHKWEYWGTDSANGFWLFFWLFFSWILA